MFTMLPIGIGKRISRTAAVPASLLASVALFLASGICHALIPLSGATKIATGNGHTCAVFVGGGVKCWGLNFFGQLGDNSNINRALPVDVIAGPSLPPLAGVGAISAGLNHTCVIVNGGAKCWGDNAKGQLGDGSTTQRLTPVNVSGLSSGVVSIATAAAHTCALLTSGNVKCWGNNLPSRLGDNTNNQSSIPVDVLAGPGPSFPLLSGATALVTGEGSEHTCAIGGGGVSCWGSDQYGQLGVNMPLLGASRVALPAVGLGGAVSKLALGGLHTCAIISGGGVQCWGSNDLAGQLGDNTMINSRTPVNTVGLSSGVAAINAGRDFTCALTTAGGAKCWGNNNIGQLGDNSQTTRLTPVDVSGLTSGVSAISAGGEHTCALTNAGGVKCWGFNGYGQLGDNTDSFRLAPVNVLVKSAPVEVPNDLSGDGKSDIAYVDASGAAGVTLINGISALTLTKILPSGSGWTVSQIADVDGDGRADLVIRNIDGRAAVLIMNGTAVVSYTELLAAGSGWTVTHAADFNGDGYADLLLNNIDGRIAVLLLNGGTILSYTELTASGSPYTPTHVGEFNNDGRADIVLKSSDGSAVILLMEGATAKRAFLLLGAGSPWSVSHVADLNGDKNVDVVLRNSDGSAAILIMLGGVNIIGNALLLAPGSPYTVTHTGDFNGDGKADLLIRNTDGSVVMLQMNGTAVTAATYLLLAGATSAVAQIADYNGDGKSDILLRNADGSATVILMNGGVVTAAGNLWGAGTLVAVP